MWRQLLGQIGPRRGIRISASVRLMQLREFKLASDRLGATLARMTGSEWTCIPYKRRGHHRREWGGHYHEWLGGLPKPWFPSRGRLMYIYVYDWSWDGTINEDVISRFLSEPPTGWGRDYFRGMHLSDPIPPEVWQSWVPSAYWQEY